MRKLFVLLILLIFFGAAEAKNGEVVWYTNIPASDAQMLVNAFERKHPLLQKTIIGGANILSSRLIAEANTGKRFADVIEFPADKIPLLKENGLVEPYCSPESVFYLLGHKDDSCYWTDAGQSLKVVAYNTSKLNEDSIPKDWDALLDPKWKNQIWLPVSNLLLVYPGLIQRWGREKAREYFTRVRKNGVIWDERGQSIVPRLVAGETPLTSVSHNLVEIQKQAGAPVAWVTTARPIVSQMQVVSLARKGPNPEAAKLFIDFMLSKEGQEIKQRQFRISGRSDMPCPLERIDCRKLDIIVVQPPQSLKEFIEIRDEFLKIIGLVR